MRAAEADARAGCDPAGAAQNCLSSPAPAGFASGSGLISIGTGSGRLSERTRKKAPDSSQAEGLGMPAYYFLPDHFAHSLSVM